MRPKIKKNKLLLRFLFTFLVFTTNFNIFANEDKNLNDNQIINLESSNLEYNLGEAEKDTVTSKTIKIRNKLKEAIYIKEAHSTCECTEIKIEPQKLEEGGVFEVEITFDSKDFGQGKTERVVYILTDSLKYELIRLSITANII